MNDSLWGDNLLLTSLSGTDDFAFLPRRTCGLKERAHFLKFFFFPLFAFFLFESLLCLFQGFQSLWSLASLFRENLAPSWCPHSSAESNLTVLFIILEQDESSLCVSEQQRPLPRT